jgi:hypothetical protein
MEVAFDSAATQSQPRWQDNGRSSPHHRHLCPADTRKPLATAQQYRYLRVSSFPHRVERQPIRCVAVELCRGARIAACVHGLGAAVGWRSWPDVARKRSSMRLGWSAVIRNAGPYRKSSTSFLKNRFIGVKKIKTMLPFYSLCSAGPLLHKCGFKKNLMYRLIPSFDFQNDFYRIRNLSVSIDDRE